MKKSFLSILLTLIFVFSLQPTTFAAGGGVLEDGSKRTPFGTMTGEIGRSPGGSADYEWFYAETSIDSSYTMAQTVAKIDVRANDTGALLDSQSETTDNGNEAVCFADGEKAPYRTFALFSTHEVIYTSSYVLYLNTTY